MKIPLSSTEKPETRNACPLLRCERHTRWKELSRSRKHPPPDPADTKTADGSSEPLIQRWGVSVMAQPSPHQDKSSSKWQKPDGLEAASEAGWQTLLREALTEKANTGAQNQARREPDMQPEFMTWLSAAGGEGCRDARAALGTLVRGSVVVAVLVLVTPRGLWDFSSLTRDWTYALCSGSTVLTTGWLFCFLRNNLVS